MYVADSSYKISGFFYSRPSTFCYYFFLLVSISSRFKGQAVLRGRTFSLIIKTLKLCLNFYIHEIYMHFIYSNEFRYLAFQLYAKQYRPISQWLNDFNWLICQDTSLRMTPRVTSRVMHSGVSWPITLTILSYTTVT